MKNDGLQVSLMSDAQREAELAKLFHAVAVFTGDLRLQLLLKLREGFTGWDNPDRVGEFYQRMLAHAAGVPLAAGEEVNVANFAMFLWYHREGRRLIEQMAAARCAAPLVTFTDAAAPTGPRGVGDGDVGVE